MHISQIPIKWALVYVGLCGVAMSIAHADNIPFAPQPVGSGIELPFKLHGADVDGDGDTDLLAATNSATQSPQWYENDGGRPATFTPHNFDPTFLHATTVFAADVDGDGDRDIVSAERIDDEIAWFENDGMSPPAFSKRSITMAQGEPATVIAADMDSDGDIDIVAGSPGDDTINWYENDGASPPAFTLRGITTLAEQVQEIHAADMDGDGDIDLLSANANTDELSWYENDGATPPTFTKIDLVTTFSNPSFITAADLDRDGDLDVIATWAISNVIAWYENNGASPPVFTERTLTLATTSPSSVSVADFDCDGDLDVAAPSAVSGDALWFESDGGSPPTFTTRTLDTGLSLPAFEVAMDFDGDGDADIATSILGDDSITYYENRLIHKDVILDTPEIADNTTTSGPATTLLEDLDGDGDLDIITAELFGSLVAWYENDGALPFTKRTVSGALSVAYLAAADIDGDGDKDIVAAETGSTAVTWYENDGGTPPSFTRRIIDTSATGVAQIAVGDLDGDGDLDVAANASAANAVQWYENDGASPPSFSPNVVTNSLTVPGNVCVADFNGDGRLDVACSDGEGNGTAIGWVENDGGAPVNFTFHLISDVSEGFQRLEPADLDNDGDLDIVTTNLNATGGGWFENSGGASPTFTFHAITSLRSSRGTIPFDIDTDGDLDLLKPDAFGGSFHWYENDGQQPVTFTLHSPAITAVGDQYGVAGGDVDGDGLQDVVIAFGADDLINYYRNVGTQYTATLSAVPITGIGQDTTPKALFTLDLTHNGIAGDRELYFKSFAMLFEESPADPITTGEMANLVDALYVRRETGAGINDILGNAFVQDHGALTLTAGEFDAGTNIDANRAVEPGETATFYFAIDPAATAASFTPDRFVATFLGADMDVVYSILPTLAVGSLPTSGNSLSDTSTNTVVFGVAPEVSSIVLDTLGPLSGGPAQFTVTFSEDVVGFGTEADLVITETGTVSHTGVTITGGPAVYTVEISGLSGDGSLRIAALPFDGAMDAGGIPLESSPTSSALTIDNTAPTITILDDNPAFIEAGDNYVDAGATASDSVDGNLTSSIVPDSTVDDTTPGSYTVTYTVTDTAGNANQAVRDVHVVDTTPPVIMLTGGNLTLECGIDTYTDPGYAATDIADGNLTGSVILGGDTVNANALGMYVITYNVTDAHSNAAAEVTRTVSVVDTTAPVITIVGDNPISIMVGDVYSDDGATALDACAGDRTGSIQTTSTVDTGSAGQYTVTYTVNDGNGNTAMATRTVHVTAIAIFGDINGDNEVNAVDIQLVINAALGVGDPNIDADVNGDDDVNAVDVQLVINAALGL